jgi:hypothetical protein
MNRHESSESPFPMVLPCRLTGLKACTLQHCTPSCSYCRGRIQCSSPLSIGLAPWLIEPVVLSKVRKVYSLQSTVYSLQSTLQSTAYSLQCESSCKSV